MKRFKQGTIGNYLKTRHIITGAGESTPTAYRTFLTEDWFTFLNAAKVEYSGNTLYTIEQMIMQQYGHHNILEEYYENELYDGSLDNCTDDQFNSYVETELKQAVIDLFNAKNVEYKKIYAMSTAEYNPLYNVDGTTVEVHSGTDTNTNSGTDRTALTGTDTLTHSGTDTTSHSGYDSQGKTGTEATGRTGSDSVTLTGDDTVKSSGTDQVANSGTDTKRNTGTQTTVDSNSDTITNKVAAFDAVSGVEDTSSTTAYGKSTTRTDNLNEAYENHKTIDTTYGKQDKTTHNTTEQTSYGSTETLTHNTTDRTDYNSSVAMQRNTSDATQYGKTETLTHGHVEAMQHGERIETTKQGNIGVTMTQQLISAELDIAPRLNFLNVVAADIARELCGSVY